MVCLSNSYKLNYIKCLFAVVIIDPGIEIFSNGYTPYTDGISMDIFIKVYVIEYVVWAHQRYHQAGLGSNTIVFVFCHI